MNKNEIKIGVLLPVYNGDKPRYFDSAFQSILNQTYQSIEIFIGVDGPIGVELSILLDNLHKYNNVHVIYFPENRGLARVLNDLLTEVRQYSIDYIARMDADDIAVAERFELQLNYLINNEDVDVIGGAIEEIDENSDKNGKKVVYPLKHKDCYSFFRYRNPLAHPAVLFRRRFFDKVGGYRDEYRTDQDTMLWTDAFLAGCILANIEQTVLLFRVTPDFYKMRRNGFLRAKKTLKDRFVINKALKYDVSADLFALLMFVVIISPSYIKRILYRLR